MLHNLIGTKRSNSIWISKYTGNKNYPDSGIHHAVFKKSKQVLFLMPESIHAKIMVMPMFYQAVQTRHALKTIPLFSFLNIFEINMQNVTKYDV